MLPKRLKEYLLDETAGRRLPTGSCPSFKEFAQEVLNGVKLWPVQKIILKTICNVHPLLPNMPYTQWELDTLKQWQENAADPFGNRKYAQAVIRRSESSSSPTVVLLVCGRGSSKSFMCGLIVSYVIRFLISLANPHKFFGLAKVKPISIQCLAGKYDQIISLFRIVKTNIKQCLALRDTYDEKVESMNFGGVVEACAYTSNADTVRGSDTFLYYHEETAFCNENTPDSNKSFTQTYEAIRPAVKNRFKRYGLMLFATSAGLKRGKTYELYKQILNGTIKNAVLFQLAVWEINPNFTKADFEQEYLEDPITADAEMGSQFVDAINTFLSPAEIQSCIKPERIKLFKGRPDVQYWIRLDPSRKNDRYALALGHKERVVEENGGERIITVVDHVHFWESYWLHNETGQRYNPKTAKERLEGRQLHVNTQEVLAYVNNLIENFNVMGVSTDQFESQFIVEELNDLYGHKNEDFGFIKPITEKSNWLAYRALRKQIVTGNFEIYNEPAFIAEALVAMRYNKNKPMEVGEGEEEEDFQASNSFGLIYTVEAPRSGPCRTDDVLDAVTFLNFDLLSNPGLAPASSGTVQYTMHDLQQQLEEIEPTTGSLEGLPNEW